MRPLRHGKRHHAVDPERRQDQRDRGEAREQRGRESIADERLRDDLIHRPDVAHRQVRVEALDDRGNALLQRRGIAFAADGHPHPREGRLVERQVDFAGDVVLDAVAPAVGDDADDLPDLGLTRLVRPRNDPSQLEALGQRIRGTEHALHEGLVDHGDELAALAVGGGDAAASRDAHAHQAEGTRA